MEVNQDELKSNRSLVSQYSVSTDFFFFLSAFCEIKTVYQYFMKKTELPKFFSTLSWHMTKKNRYSSSSRTGSDNIINHNRGRGKSVINIH